MGVSSIKDLRLCTPTPALPLQGGGGLNQRFLKDADERQETWFRLVNPLAACSALVSLTRFANSMRGINRMIRYHIPVLD